MSAMDTSADINNWTAEDLIKEWRTWYLDYAGQAYPDDDLIYRTEALVQGHPTQDEKAPYRLVVRWYRWWEVTDDVPPKLPNSLHVRTAMYLWHIGKLKINEHGALELSTED